MGAGGGGGQIAALDLVLALGTGLDPRETVGDGVVDGLIVAGLEVQEAEASERAPVASVEGVGGFQVQGAGNELALIVCHHQHGPVGEALAEQVEEVGGEDRKSTRLNSSH